MSKRTGILALFFILVTGILSAQVYPVTTQTQVSAPYPMSLSGFVDAMANKVNLQITVNDVTLAQYPVKLRMELRSNTVTITTSEAYLAEPIYLNGGEILTLNAAELADLFLVENLNFSGYSKNQYLASNQLPDGVYQLRFQVIDYARNYNISSSFPAFVYVYVNDPPILNLPHNKQKIEFTPQQNILFNWTFRHSPFSRPGLSPHYRFELWEVYPSHLDPYFISNTTEPIYSEELTGTSLNYSIMQPLLEAGKKYAWRVSVFDPDEITPFKADGHSEVKWFTYGVNCNPPTLELESASAKQIKVNWETPQLQQNFTLRYRPAEQQEIEWYSNSTNFLSHTIEPLRANTEYIIEVEGECGTQPSGFSDALTVRTDMNLEYQCGTETDSITFENQDKLLQLSKGTYFTAGDFEVEVFSVEGSNGVFSGKGFVLVPLFNFLKLEADLENVVINTDYQMIGGKVKTVYNLNNSLTVNLGGSLGNDTENGEAEENDFTEVANSTIDAGDSIQSVVVSNNTVVVTTADGTQVSEAIGNDEIVAITAPSGEEYVVDGSDNTVYKQGSHAGSAPSANTNTLKKEDQATASYTVDFTPHENQFYGFDQPGEKNPPDNYDPVSADEPNKLLPWKSIESGRFDKLTAVIEGSPADSVFFARESASMVMTSAGLDESKRSLMITGQGNKDEDELYAYYLKFKDDSARSEEIYHAGSVNLVSYEKQQVNLCLVGVNGSSVPEASYVQDYLNSIYKQAVVEWTVTELAGGLSVPLERSNQQELDNTDADSRMDYTPEMKLVNRTLKDQEVYNRNTVYLFFFSEATDANVKGYMPLKGQFGYIFKFNEYPDEYLHTIAHELGHGPFRLRHTFSPENSRWQEERSTNNLMDYAGANAKGLYKYQWDYVHDPQTMLFAWAQDEEEGAAKVSKVEFLPLTDQNPSSFSTKELKDIKKFATTEDNCTPLDAEKDWLVFIGKTGTFLAKAPKGSTLEYEIECGTIKSHTNLTEQFVQYKDNKELYDKMLEKYPAECADKSNCELVTVELFNEVGKITSKKPKGESIIVSNTVLDNLFLDEISVYGFAPSVADTKLEIKYDILHSNSLNNKLKVQVIQQESTKLMFEDEITITDENKTGTFAWDGIMNQGEFLNKKITSDDSKFSVKITYNEETKEQLELRVDRDMEEWAGCDCEDIKSKVSGGFKKYKDYKKQYINDGLSGNIIEYFHKNVHDYTFLGQTIWVHDKFWNDVLKPIDEKLDIEISSDLHYFSMRGINNAGSISLSPHAYGCAIDFQPYSNPQIYYNCDRPIFYLIKMSTGLNIDKDAGTYELTEHQLASDKFVEIFSTTTAELLYEKYKAIDSYINIDNHYKLETYHSEITTDISEIHTKYTEFLSLISEGSDKDVLLLKKQELLNMIDLLQSKLSEFKGFLSSHSNTVIFNTSNIATINSLKTSYISYAEDIAKTYETEIFTTGNNMLILELDGLSRPSVLPNPIMPEELQIAALIDEIRLFKEGLIIANEYYYTYSFTDYCGNAKVSSAHKELFVADINIKADEFDNYKLSAFGYALKERILKGQFTKEINGETILQRGFLNIPIEVIEAFKEIQDKAKNANYGKGVLDWGGEYNNKKDWMHIGIWKSKCSMFLNNELNNW